MKLWLFIVAILVFPTSSVQKPVAEFIRNCVLNYYDPQCFPKNFHAKQNAKEQREHVVETPRKVVNCSQTEDLPQDFLNDCETDSIPADIISTFKFVI